MYKKIWNYIQKSNINKRLKSKVFIFIMIIIWGLIGVLIYGLSDLVFSLAITDLICSIGCCSLVFGVYITAFYLYNHEFS